MDKDEIALSITAEDIKDKIYTIRGVQVMLDRDIAKLYSVETRVLNQAVSRNSERFPDEYCFQLTGKEFNEWKSQVVMSNADKMGLRRPPFCFSERGVAMLSTVLRSNSAIIISMRIMDAFVAMRHYLADNALVLQRMDRIELKQLEADKIFNQLFSRLEEPRPDKAVIFFKGQMWDATSCIERILEQADREIILIDSYVDRRTLDMLSRKKTGVSVLMFTSSSGNRLTDKEIHDFNAQYPQLDVSITDEFHDRQVPHTGQEADVSHRGVHKGCGEEGVRD
ncbi:MAG: ORF6N domain-containing protein [Spirochaetales bacterium]|nr:ORF6N domain-containing protein [Spirochaetales bacterium]